MISLSMMMTIRQMGVYVVAGVMLLLPASLLAQANNDAATVVPRRALQAQENVLLERKTNALEARSAAQETREAAQSANKEAAFERFVAGMNARNLLLTRRYNVMTERLAAIAEKIRQRADKVEASGSDIADVVQAHADVEEKLVAVHTLITAQSEKVYATGDAENSDNYRELRLVLLESMKTDHANIRTAMKDIHQGLRAAFVALKEVAKTSPSPSPGASVSPTVVPKY